MKKTRIILLSCLTAALVFLSACKDDADDGLSPYIGDYVVTGATLSEPLTLQTNEIGPMTVPVGTDITPMIQTALLGSLDCDPELSIIKLLESQKIFLACADSQEEIDAGTWEEQSETVIVLNLNSTAIPGSPTGVTLTVSDVTLTNSILTGETTVPVSEAMLAGIVQAMSQGNATLDQEATPDAVPITFTIKLEKQ